MKKFPSIILVTLAVFSLLCVGPQAHALDEADALSKACYSRMGPLLQTAHGTLTPEVRNAYLDWAEQTVLQALRQSHQTVPEQCVEEAHGDSTLRDALFGSVFPPDPSILQNYAELRTQLGEKFEAKYRFLLVAVSVAKRTKGVEKAADLKSIGRDYQPGFWVDESLQVPGSEAEKDFVQRTAAFMKREAISAEDLYQNAFLQQRLRAELTAQKVSSGLVGEVSKSVGFGERLKSALVVLGQRPAAREAKPSTVAWLRHLIAINEATPISTPTADGKAMPWPLFPIRTAPWPLLLPLARPLPLSEAHYIWEAFQGKHGDDRYHTYGPYYGDEDVMAHSLHPSRWFWDAWPDRILHGGMCVPLSKGTVDLYSGLGKPAMWAGQPGHANLISFQYTGREWTAEIEQAFAGGPAVTSAQWYFDEDAGTQLRFRDLYGWAGAEYHLGLAVGINISLKSYMDTRLAVHLFQTLPPAEKQTLGVLLLRGVLKANPYNPEIWYRLAQHTAEARQGLALAEAALKGNPSLLSDPPSAATSAQAGERNARDAYWKTVAPFVAQYGLLSHAPPLQEAERQRVLTFLRAVPDLRADDLVAYAEKFVAMPSDAEGLLFDKKLADMGNVYGLLRMGQRYREGDGVTQSEAKARQYLAKAANQGDGVAASLLGSLSPVVPSDWITVTASSEYKSDQTVQHLLDGSGMMGGVHDNDEHARTMWHTPENPKLSVPATGLPPSPAWVRFDFKQPLKFASLLIWNENQATLYNRGLRKIRLSGTVDGTTWFPLTADAVVELPLARGKPFLTPVLIGNRAADRPLKAVIIAAEGTEGNYGGNCYGLSAVRFVLPRLNHVVPARSITITASSTYNTMVVPQHLVDGAGMLGTLHDNEGAAATMWHTGVNPASSVPTPGMPLSPAWVRFDFERPQQVVALLLWNHNQANYTNRSFRRTRIYGSVDGVTWRTLTSQDVIELACAKGAALSEPVTIGNKTTEQPLKAVIIAAEAVEGNYGGNCYGLSAVRFIIQPE